MPWNGSAPSQTFGRTDGTRTGDSTWQNAETAGVDIVSTDHDTHDSDLKDGINACAKKDGGNWSGTAMYTGWWGGTSTGSSNAYTITPTPAVSTLTAGMTFQWKANHANTGAATLVIGTASSVSIKKNGGSALGSGDIPINSIVSGTYDGTNFELQNVVFGSDATDVQDFTTSGTYTKPADSQIVIVEMWAAGGGGGSGRRGAAGSAREGGSGGGGGAFKRLVLLAGDVGATESVTIGAGGTAGAAVTANDTSGNNGTAGGNTSFGSHGSAYGGGAGIGGTATTAAGAHGGGSMASGEPNAKDGSGNAAYGGGFGQGRSLGGLFAPTAGGTGGGASGHSNVGLGGPVDASGSVHGGAGGGAGGWITSGNSPSSGGAGGSPEAVTGGGGAGGDTTPSNGANGGNFKGGGGGGAHASAAGGTGGSGGRASGGGGGGASVNGANSGAGGIGGNGFCRVITLRGI